jgi:protein ImuA
MSAPILSHSRPYRPTHPARAGLPFLGTLSLARGRCHEICGPARRVAALMLAAHCQGPVIWIAPGWEKDRLHPEGIRDFCAPGRLIFVQPQSPADLLWALEEVLRSGEAALCVAELPDCPPLTPVRRLHLAAQAGAESSGAAPLGLLLTPGDGGAQGIETRWHMAPALTPALASGIASERAPGGAPGMGPGPAPGMSLGMSLGSVPPLESGSARPTAPAPVRPTAPIPESSPAPSTARPTASSPGFSTGPAPVRPTAPIPESSPVPSPARPTAPAAGFFPAPSPAPAPVPLPATPPGAAPPASAPAPVLSPPSARVSSPVPAPAPSPPPSPAPALSPPQPALQPRIGVPIPAPIQTPIQVSPRMQPRPGTRSSPPPPVSQSPQSPQSPPACWILSRLRARNAPPAHWQVVASGSAGDGGSGFTLQPLARTARTIHTGFEPGR